MEQEITKRLSHYTQLSHQQHDYHQLTPIWRSMQATWVLPHINLPNVQHVEVVPLVALLDDHLASLVLHEEHGVKYLTLFVILEMAEQEVAFDGLLQGRSGLVVLGDDLQHRHKW